MVQRCDKSVVTDEGLVTHLFPLLTVLLTLSFMIWKTTFLGSGSLGSNSPQGLSGKMHTGNNSSRKKCRGETGCQDTVPP